MEPREDLTTAAIRRAARGDRESLDWLIVHFQPFVAANVRAKLGSCANRADVEDLCQEVWMRTWLRLAELRSRDDELAPVLARFLASVATFVCNNHLRKLVRRGQAPSLATAEPPETENVDALAAETTSALSRAARSEASQLIESVLARLDPKDTAVLSLRVLDGCSRAQISGALGLPLHQVTRHYSRALRTLFAELPRGLGEPVRKALSRARRR